MAENPKQQEHRGRAAHASGATSIIRIAGRDVDGSLNIERALSKIKGVGMNMAHSLSIAVEAKLNIQRSTQLGSLSEEQIGQIESVIKDPVSNGLPWYVINRNKDFETGKNIHVVSNDLAFSTRQDISRDISNKTWRGHRHQYGQKVRGQHTRTTGRSGATIGVTKKSAAAGGPAATGGAAKAPSKAPAKK